VFKFAGSREGFPFWDQSLILLDQAKSKNKLIVNCRCKAGRIGAKMCEAMKDKLGRQQFDLVIQAAANGKIVSRETLKVSQSCSKHPGSGP
jgi:translation elongation factor EF-4